MINFNVGETVINNAFRGSEIKKAVKYNGEIYMIKFPDPIREKKNLLSYMNNQFSEYIGCNIFKECGFKAQETFLGVCADKNGNEKIIVACKDFAQNGAKLSEFWQYALEYEIKVSKLNIEDVYLIIRTNDLIKNKEDTINNFWDMFVIDALIGNGDRHFENWGFLEKNGVMEFAPIYDCGSSLAALRSDEEMEVILSNPNDFRHYEFNVTSCYSLCGKRIFYHEIFKNPPDELSKAIVRVVPRIDMNKIGEIITSTEGVSAIRKQYLKGALDMRYSQILIPALGQQQKN